MNQSGVDGKEGLDEALEDSFPASDPPAMTSGSTATPSEPHMAGTGDQALSHTTVFRVVEPPDADAPFGEQPVYREGRWSSAGTPVIYASATEAGAILEHLAHSRGDRGGEVLLATATLPTDCIIAQTALPSTWSDYPYSSDAQCIGDQWAREHKSLALKVPSALAPSQCNYLINPGHVDKVHLQSIRTEPLVVDPRLRR